LILWAAALHLCSTLYSSASRAEPTCEVEASKRLVIASFLCGRMSREAANRFSGPNCIAYAADRRFEDIAEQIRSYQLCGEQQFAEQLKEANLVSTKLVEALSICVPDRVDYKKIMNEASARGERSADEQGCTPERRAFLAEKRKALEPLVALSKDDKFFSLFFDRLGVRVDDAGNIRDK